MKRDKLSCFYEVLLPCFLIGKLCRIVFMYKNFVKLFVDKFSYVIGKIVLLMNKSQQLWK